jgi:hypothetical protein
MQEEDIEQSPRPFSALLCKLRALVKSTLNLSFLLLSKELQFMGVHPLYHFAGASQFTLPPVAALPLRCYDLMFHGPR